MAATEGVPLLMRILSASVSVSYRAAKIARDVMAKGDLGVVDKGKNDLQTEADRSAQRCIVASLHRQFPKVPIFGEEQLDPAEKIPDDFYETTFDEEVLKHTCPDKLTDVNDEDIVIWVDPLDGTAEYTQGLLDHVTVLIGIAVKGVATAGVIHQPFYDYLNCPKYGRSRCIWGMLGVGAFGYVRNPDQEGNIITTTRSHSDYVITEMVKACEPTEVMKVGGAGHKVLLLIENIAHAYVFASIGCKKWDTCAPEAILHAIGGKLTDIFGNPIPYHRNVVRKNTGGVLATLKNHQKYVDAIGEKMNQNEDMRSRFDTCAPAPPPLETTLSQQELKVESVKGAKNTEVTANSDSKNGDGSTHL